MREMISIVGWAAVSSAPQADDNKVSLTRQLTMTIINDSSTYNPPIKHNSF
jgi:hypothetical protein